MRRARGRLVARQAGRIAGLEVALRVFTLLDPRVDAEPRVGDGRDAAAGETLATVDGRGARAPHRRAGGAQPARPPERHRDRDPRPGRRRCARIRRAVVCTRKTTPGLRALEKYAVRCGGGANHRFGLDDAVLIKDNHLAVAGGIRPAVESVRGAVGHMVKIEVEVDTLAQLEEALALGVDAVLLDNMEPDDAAPRGGDGEGAER